MSEIEAPQQAEQTSESTSGPDDSSARISAVQLKGRSYAEQQVMLRPSDSAVQLHGDGGGGGGSVHEIAAAGVAGGGSQMPHLDSIQAAFGRHDVSGVSAHMGAASAKANEQLGANAYATNESVAFKNAPDLHTAAHESAHLVQQRGGVSLAGGVGQAGDRYEQHADAVADAVVSGKSAEPLLDKMAGGSGGGGVQLKTNPAADQCGELPSEFWDVLGMQQADAAAALTADPYAGQDKYWEFRRSAEAAGTLDQITLMHRDIDRLWMVYQTCMDPGEKADLPEELRIKESNSGEVGSNAFDWMVLAGLYMLSPKECVQPEEPVVADKPSRLAQVLPRITDPTTKNMVQLLVSNPAADTGFLDVLQNGTLLRLAELGDSDMQAAEELLATGNYTSHASQRISVADQSTVGDDDAFIQQLIGVKEYIAKSVSQLRSYIRPAHLELHPGMGVLAHWTTERMKLSSSILSVFVHVWG